MQPPKLLDQVRTVLRVKHFTLSTERAYVNWIKRFILFHHKRHPGEMGEFEIRQFVSYLAVEKKISASTQTVALSALLFLYRHFGIRVPESSAVITCILMASKHR